jgi:phenylacetic acid degradation operon negative regulatory protein
MTSRPMASEEPSDAAPVVTMSRRHAVGSDSTRSLLFTVLGELVLPSGGVAWTSAFIDLLARFGVEEKASRQTLMRTAGDGWLHRQRVGRRTCWRISDSAEDVLTAGTERIFGFTGAQRDWDGRWLFVLARVADSERSARHLLRSRLAWAGFGSPSPGLWISTYPDRADEVERVLRGAGLHEESHVFTAEHTAGGKPADLVGQAWDLGGIEQSYQEFIDTYSGPSEQDALTRLVELVHAWRRFPSIDPALPLELLPPNWIGVQAARLFQKQHAAVSAGARAEWQRLNGPDV